ncbi:MAG: hypothetical protein NVS1B12_11380 [Acidimicrobiales bacterium]
MSPSPLGDHTPHTATPPAWLSTLESLADVVAARATHTPLVPADFEYLGTVERIGLPRLHLYRHVVSRRPLALDEHLHAWRSSPGTPGAVAGYLPVPSLADALATLDVARSRRRRFLALYGDDPQDE